MDCESIREGRLEALYGEADDRTLVLVRKHEASCPACREETAAFAAVRQGLARWTLFEPNARPHAAPPLIPRWLAIAATLVLAAGGALGLARPHVSWSQGDLRISFGSRARPSESSVVASVDHTAELVALRSEIARLEERTVAPPISAAHTSLTAADVAALVRSSEERQSRALESRLLSFGDRLDTQRRLDFARMSAGLAYLDQRSGRDAARTNELMGHVLQASQRR